MESQIHKVCDDRCKEIPVRILIIENFDVGYLMARKMLNISEDSAVLVVEDAPAGVRAGKAAGCDVLGLLTTHTKEQVLGSGADLVLEDLAGLEFVGADESGIELKFPLDAAVLRN